MCKEICQQPTKHPRMPTRLCKIGEPSNDVLCTLS